MSIKGCWPRAVFYDSKTTLFDWSWSWMESARQILEKYQSGVDIRDFMNHWLRFFEGHHRRTAFSNYTPVTGTIQEALLDTFNRFGIPGVKEDVDIYRELQSGVELFPETEQALQEQQDMGVKILIYSDVEREYLDMYVSRFKKFKPDFVGSTAEAGFHKPNPQTYSWVLHKLGLQPRDVLYCAAPAFDVQGAMAAGMIAAWLVRPVQGMLTYQAPSAGAIPPDFIIEDLNDVTRILELNRG